MPTCVRVQSPTCPGWLPLEPVVSCTPGPALAPVMAPRERVRPGRREPGCRPCPKPWSASLPTPWRRKQQSPPSSRPRVRPRQVWTHCGLSLLTRTRALSSRPSSHRRARARDAPRPRDAPLCSGAEREHAVGGAGLGAEPAHHVSSSSPVAPPRSGLQWCGQWAPSATF